jgi:hypothetical protein
VTKEVERYYGCVKPEYRAVWPEIVRPPFNQPSGLMRGFTTGTGDLLALLSREARKVSHPSRASFCDCPKKIRAKVGMSHVTRIAGYRLRDGSCHLRDDCLCLSGYAKSAASA